MNQDNKNNLARVYHYDLYGKRSEKYSFLLNNTLQTVPWNELELTDPQYFFVQKDFSLKEEYDSGFSVQELFPVNSVGVGTYDDSNLVSFAKFDTPDNDLYTYRPFDTRFVDYDLKKVKRTRYSIMQNMQYGNLGLIVGRQGQAVGNMPWNLVFVSAQMVDLNVFYRGGGTVFPLYLYPESDKLFENAKRKPNLNATIINEISQRLESQFTEEKEETENTFAPIDILDYIYAVLHSPAYRERYREFLKIDFPRVPYPENAEQFWKLAALGGKLRRLHLLEGVELQAGMADYPIAGSNEVEKPQYSNGACPIVNEGRVYINDTQYFDNVPLVSWNFYIGGYQPAQKWLKDRKGRTLNYEDIRHYQKMIVALKETGVVMGDVDIENINK